MSSERLARLWGEVPPSADRAASLQRQLDEHRSPDAPDHHSVWARWLRGERVD
jgi:hypothetical protein